MKPLSLDEIVRLREAWAREYVQVGTVPAQGKHGRPGLVARYRKLNRKAVAQIAFMRGGKGARDAIYRAKSP
jgi:hypothetical protein